MQRPGLFTAFLRRTAALLMLIAAAALAPAAIAGSFELGTDAAKMAASSFEIDADGCITDSGVPSADRQPADGEHCPACCLHHHGPNGLLTDAQPIAPFAPSPAAWNGWEPSDLAEAPEPVLIQPPRA